MRRWAFVIAAGLLGAVVVHIVIVLALPRLEGRNLWQAVEPTAPVDAFAIMPAPTPDRETVGFLDPRFAYAVCRLDLTEGPRRIVVDMDAYFWSVGLFDASGRGLYSISNPAPGRGELDLFVIREADLTDLRNEPPPILEEAVVIDVTSDLAVVAVRAFIADEHARSNVEGSLVAQLCAAPFSLTAPPPSEPGAVVPPGE